MNHNKRDPKGPPLDRGDTSSNKTSQKSTKRRALSPGTYTSLQAAGFRLGKTIGVGSYSCVRLAYNLRTHNAKNQLVACKIIDKEKASEQFLSKFLPRELQILKTLNHPHIIKVINMFSLGSRLFVFMNYCSKGDLLDHIRDHGHYKEDTAKVLFRQLVDAIKYLHSNHIAHRDLKCENILLGEKGDTLTLTDFGFSRYFFSGVSEMSTTFCGSAAYAAPEIIAGIAYNPLLGDVWSLGCVLYIMITASMPYDDSNIRVMVRIQKERSLSFPKTVRVSSSSKVTIMKMLEPEPKLRASLAQIESSGWLSNRIEGRLRQGMAKVWDMRGLKRKP